MVFRVGPPFHMVSFATEMGDTLSIRCPLVLSIFSLFVSIFDNTVKAFGTGEKEVKKR